VRSLAVQVEKQVAEPLSKTEAADSGPLEDGLTLPAQIALLQDRLGQLRAASEILRARAKERYQQGLSQFQAKKQKRGCLARACHVRLPGKMSTDGGSAAVKGAREASRKDRKRLMLSTVRVSFVEGQTQIGWLR
jgi:hypothetical protein